MLSEHALIRARRIAEQAGLLFYQPGAKRQPGRYWVKGYAAEYADKSNKYTAESAVEAKGKRRESRALHTLTPIPTVVVVEKSFSYGDCSNIQDEYRQIARIVLPKVAAKIREKSTEILWQALCVIHTLGATGMELAELPKRLSASGKREIADPFAYVLRIARNKCEEARFDFEEIRHQAPAMPRLEQAVALKSVSSTEREMARDSIIKEFRNKKLLENGGVYTDEIQAAVDQFVNSLE